MYENADSECFVPVRHTYCIICPSRGHNSCFRLEICMKMLIPSASFRSATHTVLFVPAEVTNCISCRAAAETSYRAADTPPVHRLPAELLLRPPGRAAGLGYLLPAACKAPSTACTCTSTCSWIRLPPGCHIYSRPLVKHLQQCPFRLHGFLPRNRFPVPKCGTQKPPAG